MLNNHQLPEKMYVCASGGNVHGQDDVSGFSIRCAFRHIPSQLSDSDCCSTQIKQNKNIFKLVRGFGCFSGLSRYSQSSDNIAFLCLPVFTRVVWHWLLCLSMFCMCQYASVHVCVCVCQLIVLGQPFGFVRGTSINLQSS